MGQRGGAPAPAPALVLLRSQVNERWPGRSQDLDGIVRWPPRPTPSDHHDGNALDLTTFPELDGLVVELVRQMRSLHQVGSPAGRLTYVIWGGRICRAKTGWTWEHYRRSCPHVRHAHFSIKPSHRDVVRPWRF